MVGENGSVIGCGDATLGVDPAKHETRLNLLRKVTVVASRGEGPRNSKDDDLLALEGASTQVLRDSTSILKLGIIRTRNAREAGSVFSGENGG